MANGTRRQGGWSLLVTRFIDRWVSVRPRPQGRSGVLRLLWRGSSLPLAKAGLRQPLAATSLGRLLPYRAQQVIKLQFSESF
jgi:hypothetical protein